MGPRNVCPTCGRDFEEVRHTAEFPVPTAAELAAPQQGPSTPRVSITGELAVQVCSYCGKGLDQVRRLLSGQNALICDECVSLCYMVLRDELPEFQ